MAATIETQRRHVGALAIRVTGASQTVASGNGCITAEFSFLQHPVLLPDLAFKQSDRNCETNRSEVCISQRHRISKGIMSNRGHLGLHLALCVLFLVYCVGMRAQQAESPSSLEFHSSNSALNQTFKWAKHQALGYLNPGSGTIGPWFEAALPGRNAFCMRDVSHQVEGAAALGLFEANHNMLGRFATSAAASRNWAAYWEIDGNGMPSTADYSSDADFWFNLPANFDVLDASARMWRWTCDNTYRDDQQFRKFFRETLSDYLEQWQLQPDAILARERIVNRELQKGKFVDSRGIPSYTEGTRDFIVGADLLAAEYRAIRSYAEIAVDPQDRALSAKMQRGADHLQHILETVVWSPQERHFYGRIRNDRSGTGSGDTLVLYFGAAKSPDRIRGALDYVANPEYWGQINIEEESYIPIVLFRYGRSKDAYKVLFDLTRPDKLRREYPEVSYAAVAAIVSGAMGIAPSHAGDNFDVRTLAQPFESGDHLAVVSLQIRNNILDVKQTGIVTSSLLNRHGPSVRWKAGFVGPCDKMRVNERLAQGVPESLPGGKPICSTIVTVPPGGSATVTHLQRD
jgi:hypothetical protein